MRILIWHVHGGYMDSFVRGDHEYLLPVGPIRDGWSHGTAGRDWPNAREIGLDRLRDEPLDAVVLQRPAEIDLAAQATGRRPGIDIPAVYLEHNAPRPSPVSSRHPLADQRQIPIVHVTAFNQLFWDCGRARTRIVEHGVPEPAARYDGGLERIAVVINEPSRRMRVTGADLLPRFARVAPVDVFGIDAASATDPRGFGVHAGGDLTPDRLHERLACRRVYVHPYRWTSLGLSLLEAMMLGMPVVAVAATEAVRAVPQGAGVVSTDADELVAATRAYLADPALARHAGRAGRAYARRRYGLARFLSDWDAVLAEAGATVVPRRPAARADARSIT